MGAERQGPAMLVGMDAHTRRLSLCVAEWRHGSDPVAVRRLEDVALEDMESVYRRHVPQGALTLLEASGNSRVIVERLAAVGYEAKVLGADVLRGISERDRVNDRIDAEKIAYAYARGFAGGRAVWMPRGEFVGRRDLVAAYIRSSRDVVRSSNRIWAYCNSHGLPLPARSRPRKAERIRALLAGRVGDPNQRSLAEGMLEDYEHFLGRRDADMARIRRAAMAWRDVRRLMQLPGMGVYIAFAVATFVEDISRFDSPKRLVSYFGLNPSVNSSGEQERRQRRQGREHGHLSRFGRSDVKHLCAEIGQTVLRRNDCQVAKWARRKLAEGKNYNKVCMAVARKVVTYSWYVLRGIPTPGREMQAFYERKMARAYGEAGRETMAALGYASRREFVESASKDVYGHLPPAQGGLQTGAQPASA